ncbi:MAG: hypothetical protein Q4F80_00900 [bacterium]|nr:hypothetical protein [bacterium]
MIHYITSFIVYTLAMTGVLVIGYVVYKKTVFSQTLRKNPLLKIEDMMRLPDRKVLYVINCKSEQFLIASSNDKVTLISKLGGKKGEEEIERYLNERNKIEARFDEDSNPYSNQNELESKKHIIKSLLKELSDNNRTKRGNY